ncbi:hypothetical protein EC973_009628, partial [Apophysomyces ossiformis]
IINQKYPTRADLYSAIRDQAINVDGFDITIKRSGTIKGSGTQFCYFQCIHGDQHRGHRAKSGKDTDDNVEPTEEDAAVVEEDMPSNQYVCINGVAKRKPRRTTKKIGCSWVIYASYTNKEGAWTVKRERSKIDSHTHELSSEKIVYHNARKLDGETQVKVAELTEAGVRPSQIVRVSKDLDGKPTMMAKDIYNFKQKFS